MGAEPRCTGETDMVRNNRNYTVLVTYWITRPEFLKDAHKMTKNLLNSHNPQKSAFKWKQSTLLQASIKSSSKLRLAGEGTCIYQDRKKCGKKVEKQPTNSFLDIRMVLLIPKLNTVSSKRADNPSPCVFPCNPVLTGLGTVWRSRRAMTTWFRNLLHPPTYCGPRPYRTLCLPQLRGLIWNADTTLLWKEAIGSLSVRTG